MSDLRFGMNQLQPLFFEPAGDKKSLKCTLCPNFCVIKPGKTGLCGVRGNSADGNTPLILHAGRLSALASDPIEKKPLYHFYPGSEILSAGFFGCNLKCPFCQNYAISTVTDSRAETVSPENAAEMAVKSGTIGLAYTYSEPLIHIEWITETTKLIRAKRLKNVLVTNGYINPAPARLLLENMDGVNIDLKSFNDDFYRNELKGKLEPVKRFIEFASDKTHVEVTTLVIPGKNDSADEIRGIAAFMASIKKTIPLHLSCYYPVYKYSIPPTKQEKVFRLADIASEFLDYVYPGNTGMRECDTKCPSCGEILVKRYGYNAAVTGIINNKCAKCGNRAEIITELN